jgi:hypothetical protein
MSQAVRLGLRLKRASPRGSVGGSVCGGSAGGVRRAVYGVRRVGGRSAAGGSQVPSFRA